MLLIPCPWCGPRNDAEFVAGGEAHIVRPLGEVSDTQWGEYLYFRRNVKGSQTERWFHAIGCRRWFNVVRDTVTHEITGASPVGAATESAP
jgi:heterotetrameric sarcosine oxidase delta subunit